MWLLILLSVSLIHGRELEWTTGSGRWAWSDNWENNTIPGNLDIANFINEQSDEFQITIRRDVNLTEIRSIGPVSFWIKKGVTPVTTFTAKYFQSSSDTEWSIFEGAALDATEVEISPRSTLGSLVLIDGTFIGYGQRVQINDIKLRAGTVVGKNNFNFIDATSLAIGRPSWPSVVYINGSVTSTITNNFKWYLGSEIVIQDSFILKNSPEIKVVKKEDQKFGIHPLFRCLPSAKQCPGVDDFELVFPSHIIHYFLVADDGSISIRIVGMSQIMVPVLLGMIAGLLIMTLIFYIKDKKKRCRCR